MELQDRISKRIFEVETLAGQLQKQLFACDVLLGELRALLKEEDDTTPIHETLGQSVEG